ncbi:hypothetical protein [Cupriavidus basilensis]
MRKVASEDAADQQDRNQTRRKLKVRTQRAHRDRTVFTATCHAFGEFVCQIGADVMGRLLERPRIHPDGMSGVRREDQGAEGIAVGLKN